MNNFIFNSHEEFGLFLKINSEEIKGFAKDEQAKVKVDEAVKFFSNAKGGSPCNFEKRLALAKKTYLEFVPSYFENNEEAKNFLKDLLGGPPEIHFKRASQDVEPFFFIK